MKERAEGLLNRFLPGLNPNTRLTRPGHKVRGGSSRNFPAAPGFGQDAQPSVAC